MNFHRSFFIRMKTAFTEKTAPCLSFDHPKRFHDIALAYNHVVNT